ncbi:MAG: hypothetical protein MI717_06220 [Spirochaetales bacterium]|nr:hypothetical protein [Spirochaetales bacterium]
MARTSPSRKERWETVAERWWQASGAQRLADLVPYQNQAAWPHFYPVFTPLSP